MTSNSGCSLKTIFLVCALALSTLAAAGQTAPVAPRITQAIDEGKLVTLRGNTRPEATKANDRGALSNNYRLEHMMLQLQRAPEQEAALRQYLDAVEKPGSPNYHQWITAQEYGDRYGLAQQDLDKITGWLNSHGMTVNVVYPSRMVIDFSGTAGQVSEALRTEVHSLEVNGVKHIANMSDPRIPAALAPVVAGVVSLHDFRPHTMFKAKPAYTSGASPNFELSVVPADLAKIYNFTPLFNAGTSGQGQTVVVVEDTDLFTTNDWSNFRSSFGLSSFSSGSLMQVHPAPASGTNNCSDPGAIGGDAEEEATLDAEYASAGAPSATIELISCTDTNVNFGGFIALQNLLNESSTPPAVVSISLGFCEAENGAASNAAINTLYQQAAGEGVSLFVSAGDQGAASCDGADPDSQESATHGIGVSGWTTTQYNVSVGGTDFGDTFAQTNSTYWSTTNTSTFGSALSYIPEIPWSDSCASALLATALGFSTSYGSSGLCNSTAATSNNLLDFSAGSGGPSGCATGVPSTDGVVSGSCAGYMKPSWQSILGNPADNVRDTPDVSLFSGNGVWGHYYIFCYSDTASGGSPCTGAPSGWTAAGGTSFASPIWAGIQALVNQKAGGRQGNPNPTYYSLGSTEYGTGGSSNCDSTKGNGVSSSCIFYDVTQGDMDVNCTGTNNCYMPSGTIGVLSKTDGTYSAAFGTTTGWDFATGIGTVNVTNLVNNWPGVVSANFGISAADAVPTSVSAGGSAASAISVTGTGGFAGSVTLSCAVTSSFTATDPPTCSVTGTNPAVLSASTTTVASSVSFSTRAASMLMRVTPNHPAGGGWLALAAAIILAALMFLGAPAQRRLSTLAAALVFVALVGLAACGGGSSGGGGGGGGGGSGGTTSGSYTVTVSAASGGTTQTAAFTVTVN
jgi:subtilase family serine protease